MRRPPILVPALIAVLAFAGGWTARGMMSVGSDFGRLKRVPRDCSVKGRPLRELDVYPAFEELDRRPGEGRPRRSVRFRQDRDRAELWLVETGLLDDEVNAESIHYSLAWRDGQGWVVTDCDRGIRYQPGRP